MAFLTIHIIFAMAKCSVNSTENSVKFLDDDSETSLQLETSFGTTNSPTTISTDIEIEFLILGCVCASVILIVLAFAIGSFYCGCGYMSCGITINRYQEI